MTELFVFHVHSDGFCEIRVTGEFSNLTSLGIAKEAHYHARTVKNLPGILLDMRENASVSMVRLSSLLDSLSRIQVPLAVVFRHEQHRELAYVLHHTLAHRDYVSYFTTIDAAWAFLRANPTHPG